MSRDWWALFLRLFNGNPLATATAAAGLAAVAAAFAAAASWAAAVAAASAAAAANAAHDVAASSSIARSGDSLEDFIASFTAFQRKQANEVFDDLFDDGIGIEDEGPPPSREDFVEFYITEALNRETRRILAQKGFSSDSLVSKQSKPFAEVDKKDSPQTLEAEMERLVGMKRQRRAVRERVRDAKPVEVLGLALGERSAFWEVSCGELLYRKHVYDAIPRCTPSPPSGPPCRRLIIDDVASTDEQAKMMQMMDRSFEGLFHQGAETMLVPDESSRERMGNEGFDLTLRLLERVRMEVARSLNISAIFYSGSLLKRMDFPPLHDAFQIDPKHDSWNPHIDKANIASYDYSALLYLNSVGRDYGGGELAFHDEDMDRVVEPKGGRLVAFTSGLENLHRVQPMRWGRRYVLSMWFTCSALHAHPTIGHSGSITEPESPVTLDLLSDVTSLDNFIATTGKSEL
eukprot:TRINITY_DN69109_c0_g1_i1.p1 TRINITY_DN69109_c0_g1~~TRINITY_DN69109_c0_g1_i1.p1  ORF type:complete len:460 (-),score=78.78 TRINITY_DN69109_c0_g1_i1:99-1478(-)